MIDTPQSINALADDWMLNEGFDNAEAVEKALRNYADLLKQVAAHERECAGVWVKVTERLPEPNKDVWALSRAGDVNTNSVSKGGAWVLTNAVPDNQITHWLDARMPGEERWESA